MFSVTVYLHSVMYRKKKRQLVYKKHWRRLLLTAIFPTSPIFQLSRSTPNLVDYSIKSFKSSAKKKIISPDGQASQVLSRNSTTSLSCININSFRILTLPGAHYWTSGISLHLASRVTEWSASNELDTAQAVLCHTTSLSLCQWHLQKSLSHTELVSSDWNSINVTWYKMPLITHMLWD